MIPGPISLRWRRRMSTLGRLGWGTVAVLRGLRGRFLCWLRCRLVIDVVGTWNVTLWLGLVVLFTVPHIVDLKLVGLDGLGHCISGCWLC